MEGLVKSDRRTMRKPKQNFSNSLGWDITERVAELSSELQSLNIKYTALSEKLKSLEGSLQQQEGCRRFYSDVIGEIQDLAGMEAAAKRLESLARERDALLKENPDYRKLREQEVELKHSLRDLQKRQSSVEAEIEFQQKRIKTLTAVLPLRERELKESLLYGRLRDLMGGEFALTEELKKVEADLIHRKRTRMEFEAELV